MKIGSNVVRTAFGVTLFSSSLFAFDLEGKVRLEGPVPPPEVLTVDPKQAGECGSEKISPALKVSPEGFVANAVVKLEGTFPESTLSPKENYALDQVHCEFSPHLLLLPKGESLSILNSDGFLHNVRAFNEKAEMLFNDAMPKKGQVLKKSFKAPGRYVLRCGIHSWMHALVMVREHPFYALTDGEGRFKIRGIPDGNYTLSVWHEELGEIHTEVSPLKSSVKLTYPKRVS